MARPRRETKQLFFDQFCDFDLEDQSRVLELLQEFHRQKKRLARAVPSKTDSQELRPHGNHLIRADGVCIRCKVQSPSEMLYCQASQGLLLDGPVAESGHGGSSGEK